MNKYLIGNSEEFKPLAIVNAENGEEALKILINNMEIDERFIDYLHSWAINMSFSEQFFYDENNDPSEEPKSLPIEESKKRTNLYFKEKPEYEAIYWRHWNAEPKHEKDFNMARFPDDMINWIWRKELTDGKWILFEIYAFATIPQF